MRCEISQIDLAAWRASPSEEEKDRMAEGWQGAFRSQGLIYLTNHGLESQYQATSTSRTGLGKTQYLDFYSRGEMV